MDLGISIKFVSHYFFLYELVPVVLLLSAAMGGELTCNRGDKVNKVSSSLFELQIF